MAGADSSSLLMRPFQRTSPVFASSATMSPWLAPATTRPSPAPGPAVSGIFVSVRQRRLPFSTLKAETLPL
jgi:hypothetical protein